MKNILVLFILSISTQISFANISCSPYKTALIIDNYDYKGYDALPDNSTNIRDLASSLRQLGFEIKVLSNPNSGEMNDVVRAFYNNLPAESISLLYYGGRISSAYAGQADLVSVDNAGTNPLKNSLSIETITNLTHKNSGAYSHNFLLFDAFFDIKNKKTKDIVEQINVQQESTICVHDAKNANLIGEPSNFIPKLLSELFQAQYINDAFKNIDAATKSSSRVNTNLFTSDVFKEEQLTSAVMVMSAMDMPTFPFPPPKASASYTFDKQLFSGINNLTQSSQRIESALKKSGYFEKSYYQIPNGYALVTRIEKMESDGTPATEEERWNVNDTGSNSSFDFLSYFKSLFFANEGHYRIIVFLVTSDNVQMTDRIMLMSEGQDFLSSGLNRLPPQFEAMPFTENHYCTALIYEWYKVEHEEAKFMEPSKFLGQYHLAKNKFVEYLEAEK